LVGEGVLLPKASLKETLDIGVLKGDRRILGVSPFMLGS
jgi:hypothetical protein